MKKTYLAIIISFFSVFFFILPHQAKADCTESQVSLNIITRDADGVLLPNINFAVFHQNINVDGNPYLGNSLTSGKTDAGGQNVICLKKTDSPYAVKLYEYNANYGYYMYWFSSLATEGSGYKLEARLSYMRVIVRDAESQLLKDIIFDVYVQEYDVDGKPIIGENKLNQSKLVYSKYYTGETGMARAYLSEGTYVLRIHGAGSTYYYLWDQHVYNEAVKPLEYKLSTLKVILQNATGVLLTNRTFSIYKQSYDVLNRPILGDVVVANLNVGEEGEKDTYLPAGTYALKISGSQSGVFYNYFKVAIKNERLTNVIYRLSGIRVITHDNKGTLLTNKKFSICLQGTDAAGRPTVKKTVLTSSTDILGFKDLYLTPERYALIIDGSTFFNLDVFVNQITIIDWPKAFSLRPAGEIVMSSPISNNTLTIKILPSVTVGNLLNFKKVVSQPYKTQAQSISSPYTIIFFYNTQRVQQGGINPNKLRIAYYNEQSKKWSYVGRNYVSKQQSIVVTKDKGIFILVETK